MITISDLGIEEGLKEQRTEEIKHFLRNTSFSTFTIAELFSVSDEEVEAILEVL